MKQWNATFNGNKILIENRAFSEKLFVNGELQDERLGLKTESRLYGTLSTGENIKVSLGAGIFTMGCRLFINNKLISFE